MTGPTSPATPDLDEVQALRARVAQLEEQLLETEAWAHRTVASAQERVYWLDRWQVDLNAVMRHPAADRVRALLRAGRSVYRLLQAIRSRAWLHH